MNNEKKVLGVSTLAVIALIVIMVGATYAFFKGVDAANTDTPLEVTTNTVDSLIFNIDADITLVADMSNFTEGLDNRVGEAHATATLKANNKTNSASDHYYLYFDIKENGLSYTTDDNTPELLLQVSGPDGEVTEISGLEYVTVEDGQGNEVSGFDITTKQDLITLVSNKEITATSTTVDDWDVKVVLVNLDADQSANGGKKFNGQILIQKESIIKTIGEVCKGENLASCIKDNYQLDANIYYHESSLPNGAGDNSYRYAGSYESVENYVCFGYDGVDTCPWDNMYRIIGVFDNQVKLIKADYAKDTELGTGGDYGEIYSSGNKTTKGKNKVSEIGGYYWNYGDGTGKNANVWANSKLNTINLNGTFLNSLSTNWQSKIVTTNWKVGGNISDKIRFNTPSVAYQSEIVNPVSGQPAVNNKIGLMYMSDYYYAALPIHWSKYGFTLDDHTDANGNYGVEYDYRSAKDDDWMYMGLDEWTMTRMSNEDVAGAGWWAYYIWLGASNYTSVWHMKIAVRPVFYLDSSVTLNDGLGTLSDPYIIS